MKKLIFAILFLSVTVTLNAQSFTISKRVMVVRSKPIYANITKRVPYQECWNEQVPVRRYYNSDANSNIGALIGGITGGIIGHQVGGGGGKIAATVGGAIIGTLVGNNLSRRNTRSYTSGYRTQRRCVTKYNDTYTRAIIRYKNIAYFKGQKIVKFSNRALRFIRIREIIEY